jgi:hypothetical protein
MRAPYSPRAWHRLFGVGLVDLFADSGWRMELEKDLARQSQLLDVVVIAAEAAAPAPPARLPDGLENLRPHDLPTYKPAVRRPCGGASRPGGNAVPSRHPGPDGETAQR